MRKAAQRPAPEVPADVLRRVRIPFIQRAHLRHGGTREDLFLVDLGLRGVYVERPEPLPLGTLVEVSFELPGNAIPLCAQSRVAWVHRAGEALAAKWLPPGCGLEFVDLPEGDAGRLTAHLLTYLARHPGHRKFARQWPTLTEEEEPIP